MIVRLSAPTEQNIVTADYVDVVAVAAGVVVGSIVVDHGLD